ncbi:glycosyltransferase family A protein [uncultured Eubacterium sp.]|uniref:glycosyltransferase family A protein n=1 Tax=uncultured Eubacterium sp. TaxID=165185 RepID=UPI0026756190|nr:glycosyltransferase family A protein [uncultured Eubacterium sp.]
MSKLGILVTQYNEDEKILKNLLDSIAVQQNVDLKEIEVIICNDGSDTIISSEFFNKYDFSIKYIRHEHKGVSATRNACLDNSTAEYVMFCDIDDMFENMYSLSRIFFEMQRPFDGLVCSFIEELKIPDGTIKLLKKDNDSVFVHGKVYRRAFLVENNIRWNENLTIHEDSYFNILCKQLAKEYRCCNEQIYIWKWRDASVCRRDPKYMLKTYTNLLDSNEALIDELTRRGMGKEAGQVAYSALFDFFYTLNKQEWMDSSNAEYVNKTLERFRQFFAKYQKIIANVSDEEKKQIIYMIRNRMSGEGVLIETLTFKDFMMMVGGTNEQ